MPSDYEDSSSFRGKEVDRVSVRVPPFYPTKPSMWFAALESQFVLANITQDTTKYHYTVSSLESMYADVVEDIINAPSAPDKYERLKTELIKRLTASQQSKVKQLLNHEELGDRKPSQFLRHLKHLAGPGVPDDFIRTLWTGRLPSSMQTIIASQAKATLEEAADLADQIMDIVAPVPQVAAAQLPLFSTAPVPSSSTSSEIAELTRQVAALTAQVDRLSRSRDRNRTNNRRGGRSSSRRSQSSYRQYPVCWYHSKHGSNAKKCIKPCDYAGNGQGGR